MGKCHICGESHKEEELSEVMFDFGYAKSVLRYCGKEECVAKVEAIKAKHPKALK